MTGLVKPPLELKKRVLSPKQKKQSKVVFGSWGEREAALFLEKKGFEVWDRNVRVGQNEVDIVAFDQSCSEVVFVEVKTRKNKGFGHASLAVDQQKINSMCKVARVYMSKRKLAHDYRFDIITVTPQGVEHFENISWGM